MRDMGNASVFDYILEHQKAADERLYLIPSENALSARARFVFLTEVLNRYYFPLETHRHWAFPGNEWLEKVYARCRELLSEAAGASFVNIRPISGVNAMTIALAALCRPGETIATLAPENGGHPITARVAERLGIKDVHLPYRQEEFSIDTERFQDFIEREGVSLVYLDAAQILFPHKVREMRSLLPNSVKIYYDGSHVMGLIFGKQFQDPFGEGADFLGGSTHKTLPGPHKAFIATNDAEAHERLAQGSSILVSHDHGGDGAALAVVLEDMRGRWQGYAAQVVKNARRLAEKINGTGIRVIAERLGFTRSHQLWIDIAPIVDPYEAVLALARCNVISNTIRAPSLNGGFALRLGVQEMTYLGAREKEMDALAGVFEELFVKRSPESSVRALVAEIRRGLKPAVDPEMISRVADMLSGRKE